MKSAVNTASTSHIQVDSVAAEIPVLSANASRNQSNIYLMKSPSAPKAPQDIRLLFISEGYPPVDGGVATSTQRIARSLTRMGCKVLVISFDHARPLTDPDYIIKENDEDFDILRVGPFFRRTVVTEQSAAVARRRVFDQIEPLAHAFNTNIVLSFYATTAGLLGTYIARSLGVPHIAGLRGNDIGRNIFSFHYLQVLHPILQGCQRAVCVNEHLHKRLLLAFPEAKDRSSVILNSVDLPDGVAKNSSRSYLSKSTSWNVTDKVAVFLGMPREKKGISILLQAVEQARQKVPLRLLMIGPALRQEDLPLCGKIWDKLVAEDILHVTGHLDRKSALQIASEGDFIVMPSIEDGLANGLLEGMALGLCPIVSDLFSETVIPSQCGWVAKRNDTESLVNAFVDAVQSRDESNRFAAAAKMRVNRLHEPKGEAEAYVRVFYELMA